MGAVHRVDTSFNEILKHTITLIITVKNFQFACLQVLDQNIQVPRLQLLTQTFVRLLQYTILAKTEILDFIFFNSYHEIMDYVLSDFTLQIYGKLMLMHLPS